MNFFEHAVRSLPDAAASPLAFVAYLVTIAMWAWTWGRARHLRTLLDQLEKLPEKQRQELVRLQLGVALPKSIDFEQWVNERRQRFRLYAFMVLCLLLLSLVAIGAWTATR